ncbi:MAG: hypothetical protein SFT91_01910 [Rickettsiaceae bacterium]|nr:hypothetical protein [Rickettsiaceae bacterium]
MSKKPIKKFDSRDQSELPQAYEIPSASLVIEREDQFSNFPIVEASCQVSAEYLSPLAIVISEDCLCNPVLAETTIIDATSEPEHGRGSYSCSDGIGGASLTGKVFLI